MSKQTEYQVLSASIKKILKNEGILYKDFAHTLGTTESNIKKILNSKDGKLSTIKNICRKLDMSVFDLYSYTLNIPKIGRYFCKKQQDLFANDLRFFTYYYELAVLRKTGLEIAQTYGLERSEQKYYVDNLLKVQLAKIDGKGNLIAAQSTPLTMKEGTILQHEYKKELASNILKNLMLKENTNDGESYLFSKEIYVPREALGQFIQIMEETAKKLLNDIAFHERFKSDGDYFQGGVVLGINNSNAMPGSLDRKEKNQLRMKLLNQINPLNFI